MTSLANQLAEFICGLSYEQLPPEVIDKAKTFILHGVGVGLASYDSHSAKTAMRMIKNLGTSPKGATLLVEGGTVPANMAAFANGTLLHSRGQEDDFHRGMMHLGVVTLPAALALTEVNKKGGKDLILATAVGYEVGARLSKEHSPYSIARGLRSTSLYGPAAAAAASSKILRLSELQTVHALGWAANCGSGLLQCAIAQNLEEMLFHAGFASSNGVLSALLAQEGGVACDSALDGERGFYQAFTGIREGLSSVVRGIGKEWEMMDTFFKLYPVGGLDQTPVSGILSLVEEHDLKANQVQQITVKMSPKEASYPGADSLKPSALSVQFCVATALVHGCITFASIWHPDNPEVLNLMRRIKVIADDSLNPLSCDISLTLNDGRSLRREMILDPLVYCLTLQEDVALISSLVPEMAVHEEKARRAIDIMANLEKCHSLDELIENLVI